MCVRLKLLSDLKSTLAGKLFQTLTTRSRKKVDLTRIVQCYKAANNNMHISIPL